MASAKTVVLYHANCPDGFGGAYAAWKKFSENALYLPVSHGEKPPQEIGGAHVYLIDFCYPRAIMEEITKRAAEVTVLDHHLGVQDVVESIPEHVFATDHSGATIAWSYLHPHEPVPALLRYVEDGDLYRFSLPDTHAILSYVYTEPFDFPSWDSLREKLEDAATRAKLVEKGTLYYAHHQHIVKKIAESAKRVLFEGYPCYLASASRFFASDVGHTLIEKLPPLALILSARVDGIRVSLRSNGDVDVSALARKYGGNGNPQAAAFSIPYRDSMPWQPLPAPAQEKV